MLWLQHFSFTEAYTQYYMWSVCSVANQKTDFSPQNTWLSNCSVDQVWFPQLPQAHTRLCVLFQLDWKVPLLLSSAVSPAVSPAFSTVGICLIISGEIAKAESRLPNVWFINILFFVTSRYSRLVRKSLLWIWLKIRNDHCSHSELPGTY